MPTVTSIPKRVMPREECPAGRIPAIPLRIFQTFESDEVPDRMAEAAASWPEHNPAFTYHFFDADDRRAFIDAHFGPRMLQAYDQIPGGAFRADFWRYCVLAVHGGVYADVDSTCEADLLSILDDADVFVSARAGNLHWGIYNGFICSVPRHPFLEQAIERATAEILAWRPDEPFDGYMITGPGNLGMAVNQCLGRRKKAGFDWGRQKTGPFRYRLFRKIAKSPDRAGHLLDQDALVVYTDYPEYRADIASTGNTHWTEARRSEGLLTRISRRCRRLARRFM